MERNGDLKRNSMQSSEAVLALNFEWLIWRKLETLLWRRSSRTMVWTIQNQHHTPWTISDQIFESTLSRNSARRGVSPWGTHLAFGHPPLLNQYCIRISYLAVVVTAVSCRAISCLAVTCRMSRDTSCSSSWYDNDLARCTGAVPVDLRIRFRI